ncbi:MAG: XRE family transcriptional regulator [Janthinobacterium lividum]
MENALGDLLRSAREAKSLTQAQVGGHVGITYSAVGQYESGTIKKPRPDRLKAIADLLEIDSDLLNKRLIESYGISLASGADALSDNTQQKPTRTKRITSANISSDVELARDAPDISTLGGARNVPEHGIAVGGEDDDFTLNGEVIDYHSRPTGLAKRDVFVVRVKGTSMEPRFREGHLLYVERKRQPGAGDDAVVELHPEEEDGAGRAFIKELVSKGMATVVVRQFNPAKEITYPRERVKALYRVVPNNELFGF